MAGIDDAVVQICIDML